MDHQEAYAPELDAALARQLRERGSIRVAADRRDRCPAGQLGEHRLTPDVAAVEDVVNAREGARHLGMEHAVRVGDDADRHSLCALPCAMRWKSQAAQKIAWRALYRVESHFAVDSFLLCELSMRA
jgi:hypothetical protein